MSAGWILACGLCGRDWGELERITCSDCGGPAIVRYRELPFAIAGRGGMGLWRYREWLPIERGDTAVSLGEGATPLVRLDRWGETIGLDAMYAKLEFAGPTGSFKDRGASVLVSHALAAGAGRIVEDSSGNAGAAIAAYAARAGLGCQIFAPAAAPEAKLAQIRAYGADLIAVEGSRETVAERARTAAEASEIQKDGAVYYAGHNSNPYFVEGTKTFALELFEQIGSSVAHVVMPVGGGSLFCGTALGFEQLRSAGIAPAVPRLHLVQADACMPLVAAFERGAAEPLSVERRPTIAGGITIERPQRGSLILRMLRDSNGSAIAVSEDEIETAQGQIARLEGIYMEPTSAAAFAGVARLAALGVIESDQAVIVPVTGSGLKDTPSH